MEKPGSSRLGWKGALQQLCRQRWCWTSRGGRWRQNLKMIINPHFLYDINILFLLLTNCKHGFHFNHRQVLVCVLQFFFILFKDTFRVFFCAYECQLGAKLWYWLYWIKKLVSSRYTSQYTGCSFYWPCSEKFYMSKYGTVPTKQVVSDKVHKW